jgi:hypothetical protein
MAPPTPTLKGSTITVAPADLASAAVWVRRSVVDDEYIRIRNSLLELADDGTDRLCLVPGRHG